MSQSLKRFKTFINQPGVEFCLFLLMPLILVVKVEPSHWVTAVVLAYAIVIGRLYGGIRWLEGFKKGIEAERESEKNRTPG
jgi:hypothetical protein